MLSLNFILEWSAAITGLSSVLLTARRNIVCWPIGIVSVAAYLVFFARIKLYADSGLQVFFLITSFYGWWHWSHGGAGRGPALIIVLSWTKRLVAMMVVFVASWILGWFLNKHTDASFPFWDSFTAGLSVAAQLLLMRKILDSWYLWIAVDVLSLGLYSAKGAWVTFGLYGVFLVLAIGGCIAWRRALARGETV